MRELQDRLAQEEKEWSFKREKIEQEVEAKKNEMIKYQVPFFFNVNWNASSSALFS